MVDAIERQLKNMIAQGQIMPGAQLPSERDLQVQLGVSRLPLREALARLQALGLIRIRHGKGAFVEEGVSRSALSDVLIPFFPRHNAGRLRELVEARGFLESEITGLATTRATEEDLKKLDALCGDEPRLARQVEAFASADYAFHHEIARIAGNSFLSLMHEAIGPHIRSFLSAYARTEKDRINAIGRNRQLAAAIRGGDPKVAAQLAREHLQPCLKAITAATAVQRVAGAAP